MPHGSAVSTVASRIDPWTAGLEGPGGEQTYMQSVGGAGGMSDRPRLMIPGPVSLAPEVREAMSGAMISHRGPAFEAIYRECRSGVQAAFGTDDDLVFVNGTGSAAMEVAVSNVVDRGDAVVCITNGKFGELFERMARRYTDEVRTVASEWGQPIDLDAVDEALDDDVVAVTMVHTESSGGVTNPVGEVGDLLDDTDAVFVVDCVASVATETLRVDEWHVDMAATSSQKGLGAPPGVAALTVSEAARAAIKPGRSAHYFDLEDHLSYGETDQTPTTSPVQLFRGLQAAVRLLRADGLDRRVERLGRMARAVREAGHAMGLEPYPRPDERTGYANAVTVLELPAGIDSATVVDDMAERGVMIRPGLGHLRDDTIRIGTMGDIDREDVLLTIEGLRDVLGDRSVDVGSDGVARAERLLADRSP